jgi:hypothetical protein
MLARTFASVVALALALPVPAGAQVAKLPDWSGQWVRVATGPPRYDYSKPPIHGQQAPLTDEYRALHEASIADQAAGGQGLYPGSKCIPMGMPRQMDGIYPFEFILSSGVTHVLFEYALYTTRRIYTDGRDWPKDEEPTFAGYSIGKWIDEDRDGRHDVLEVETRNFMGPRVFDPSGMPLHADNQTIIKERIYLDRADPNLLRAEMTTYDHALTRPWSVVNTYRRMAKVIWTENGCSLSNDHVFIGKENYVLSADGLLMPTKKDQPPPDLRYFNQPRK